MQTLAAEHTEVSVGRNRLVALVVTGLCMSPLIVAAMLKPSAGGMGTHTQLGLPDCGFKLVTGLPCATCGCTTAFAHATNGSLLESFLTQPFGAVLALALAMTSLLGMWSVWTGQSLAPIGRAVTSRRSIMAWVALLLIAWGYKILVVLNTPPV